MGMGKELEGSIADRTEWNGTEPWIARMGTDKLREGREKRGLRKARGARRIKREDVKGLRGVAGVEVNHDGAKIGERGLNCE